MLQISTPVNTSRQNKTNTLISFQKKSFKISEIFDRTDLSLENRAKIASALESSGDFRGDFLQGYSLRIQPR